MSEAVGTGQSFICSSSLLKCNTIYLAEETMSSEICHVLFCLFFSFLSPVLLCDGGSEPKDKSVGLNGAEYNRRGVVEWG